MFKFARDRGDRSAKPGQRRINGTDASRGSRASIATVLLVGFLALVIALVTMISGGDSDKEPTAGEAGESTATEATTAPTAPPSTSTTAPTRPAGPPITLAPPPGPPRLAVVRKKMKSRGFEQLSRTLWEPHTFNVSSFNILGASHTNGRSGRPGFRSGLSRVPAQLSLLQGKNISIAGLQEFQSPQISSFMARTNGSYGVFPGNNSGLPVDNSIIWRTSEWEAIQTESIAIPYFRGRPTQMPYVLLESTQTGRRVWVANFHNPANVAGPAAGLRAEAIRREAALAKRLNADGTPVIITGDMNDRAEFACPFTKASGMKSADGAKTLYGNCVLPKRMNVDWIMGTEDMEFSDFGADFSTKSRKISDHPMITSTVSLPGVEARVGCRSKITNKGLVWFCRA